MRFAYIDAEKARYPVTVLCRLFDVSEPGFYAWKKRPPSKRATENARLTAHIKASFKKSRETYGSPRLTDELRDNNVKAGRHRVARLMREAGIRAKKPKRFKATTDSNHDLPRAPNIVKRRWDELATEPNKLWVSDLTYIWTWQGWVYLVVFLDVFSRKVVGWKVDETMEAHVVTDAMKMAMTRRSPTRGLILHSDQGSQYASNLYRTLIEQNGFQRSMSRKGDCLPYPSRAAPAIDSTPGEVCYHSRNPSDAVREDSTMFPGYRPLLVTGACAWMIMSLTACRNRSEDSSLSHRAGNLSRTNIVSLTAGPCDALPSDLPNHDDYLRRIMMRIVAGSPDVFVGPYAPEKFCIEADPNSSLNAYAQRDGRIVVLGGFFQHSENDATVAAVVAHELAHILMQHSALGYNPMQGMPDHPDLVANAEWQRAREVADRGRAERLAEARSRFNKALKARNVFIEPLRDLLKPATRAARTSIEDAIEGVDRQLTRVDAVIAEAEARLQQLETTEAWRRMTPEQQRVAKSRLTARLAAYRDSRIAMDTLLDSLTLQLRRTDAMVDDELGRALTRHLGGILGSTWRSINREYADALENLRTVENEPLNTALLVDASRILGFDYVRENWMEAEADQVGLELYLRAGFALSGFPNLFRKFDEVYDPRGVEGCDQAYSSLQSGQSTTLPERGRRTHPYTCWRRVNTGITEPTLHSAEFAPLLPAATTINAFPGELNALRTL